MSVFDWVSGRVFKFVHGNNLVYNTCWEDPRLDRVALKLQPSDNVLVITSAGCNALDYALCGPNHVHAVDMNPRQNALLDLKIAGIKSLEFEDFFRLFGYGFHPDARRLYQRRMRPHLPALVAGLVGPLDQVLRQQGPAVLFPRHQRRVRPADQDLHRPRDPRAAAHRRDPRSQDARRAAGNLREAPQAKILVAADAVRDEPRHDAVDGRRAQGPAAAGRNAVRRRHRQVRAGRVEAVFCKLPLADNYFWRVYMKGEYSRGCCPEYLKAENFEQLKGGLVERVSTHTDSVQGFLERHDGQISRYVLLDHMDWLSDKFFPLLELEWQAILDRAAPGTRIIWRSGGLKTDFLDRVNVTAGGQIRHLPELLSYHRRPRRRAAREGPRAHLRQLLHRRPGRVVIGHSH